MPLLVLLAVLQGRGIWYCIFYKLELIKNDGNLVIVELTQIMLKF